MDPIQATEFISVEEAVFSKDEKTGKMTAKVNIIKAGRAKNPRNYRASTLQRAAKEGVYNGVRMFVNHSDKPVVKRSPDEMVSAVESTEWDAKKQAIVGTVEFFDEQFFERAQRAQKYMGVSANHRIAVTRVKESSGQMIEDVTAIVGAHSVDWVVYPSAGGEILSFAKESEGVDQVEWDEVTLDLVKEHAPTVLEQYKAEVVKETPPEIDPKKDKEEKTEKEAVKSDADIQKIVQEQVSAIMEANEAKAKKVAEAGKSIRDLISKSGLKPLSQNRLISQFSTAEEFDQKAVQEAIDNVKAELKEAGAGPRISGMGASGADEKDRSEHVTSVRESVEGIFIKPKDDKKATTPATSGKES